VLLDKEMHQAGFQESPGQESQEEVIKNIFFA
jgi:hypothetical protein